jgi:hypothetical protein
VHVTLRTAPGLPSFRRSDLFRAVSSALAVASRDTFRLLHFSVQRDHLHLVVEADEQTGLTRAIQGLAIRIAKAVNRVVGRHGRVWGDRFHARSLKTPREVRNALVYVLNNWRKHIPGAVGMDPRSSAAWFTGWRNAGARCDGPIAPPRTWLARLGWRRYGPIELEEAPRRRDVSGRLQR